MVDGHPSCFHAKPNQNFNQTNPGWPKPRHLVILDSSADRPKIFKWQLDLQTGSRLIQPLPWHDMSSTVWLQNSPFFKRRQYISILSSWISLAEFCAPWFLWNRGTNKPVASILPFSALPYLRTPGLETPSLVKVGTTIVPTKFILGATIVYIEEKSKHFQDLFHKRFQH